MNKGGDSKQQIKQFKLIIKEKCKVHQMLLEFIGISEGEEKQKAKKEKKSDKIYQFLKKKKILTNKCEFREFLATVSHLWEMHHQSKKAIKDKIENLLIIMKKDIKNVFTEDEISKIFRNNIILLFLIEQNILSIETIIKKINSEEYIDWHDAMFFYPEIKKYDENYFNKLTLREGGYSLKYYAEENDKNQELFDKNRREGGKEQKIMELIREDKIEEFISFVEHTSIDLNERYGKEDSLILIDNIFFTPFEYAAFFGSIAIFKYLYMKNVFIDTYVQPQTKNVIECAVQGRNYEIIHLLEERNEIKYELKREGDRQMFLVYPIKMHHNEIFEYFKTNYNFKITEEIINLFIIYHNFQLLDELIEKKQINFENKAVMNNIFYSFCKLGNDEIVKILINHPNIDINFKAKILDYPFQTISIFIEMT